MFESPVDRYNPDFLLDDPYFVSLIEAADRALPTTPVDQVPALFERLPLDVFALLAVARPPRWPHIAAWLPDLPDAATQTMTTGAAGRQSMLEAACFIRAMVASYERDGRSIAAARVLDYGICWARLSRLLYKYLPTVGLFGVDAWATSLALAQEVGYRGQLALIEAAPDRLPFDGAFDIVFAFSIFTHLPERVAARVVTCIANALRPGGLFALTIRPRDFHRVLTADNAAPQYAEYDRSGFSFTPEPWMHDTSKPTYGNAIVSIDYIRRCWTAFSLTETEVSATDPYQLAVMLRRNG